MTGSERGFFHRSRVGRFLGGGLPLILAAVIAHAALFCSDFGQNFELKWFDRWVNLRGAIAPPDDVVIVAMDQQSYGQLGLSPTEAWPRAVHARLVKRLQHLGARRVVFDVLFVGPGSDPAGDAALAQAFSAAPVVVGAEIERGDTGGYEVSELVTPYEPVTRGAGTALVNLPEKDGAVRGFLTLDENVGYDLPTLAEAGAGIDRRAARPDSRALVNFYAPAGHGIRVLSYYQVLEEEVPLPEHLVRDKVVFVGLMLQTDVGPAQKDSFMTPFGRMFGVEIHATAAANIAHQHWIRRASLQTELICLSILAVLVSTAAVTLAPVYGAFVLLGALALWGCCGAAAHTFGWLAPGAVLFALVAPLTYLVTTLLHYVQSRRERRELERAFGYYLAPVMVGELARNPDALKLGGDLVEATAVFTDLADFTSISETLTPQALVGMLNDYFTVETNVVLADGGTLIKFIGDAMFALWGAPVAVPDHAARAIAAAEKMQRALRDFNTLGKHPRLEMRIGINTGLMVVGNLGAETRFDYTAIGDSVNLASRVEGLNKYLGTSILVTEESYRASGRSDLLRMGTMRVKGKETAVVLYALFIDPLSEEARGKWSNALHAFEARRWRDAERAFGALEAGDSPLLTASVFYQAQIALAESRGVADDWRGEITFEVK